MIVVGLSGAQGGGKSSLLKELMARGWELDQFRVSRAVQAQLGWDSLDRVMDSPETMMAFQQEVLKQKYEHDVALARDESNTVILTERTFADINAYTHSWAWKFVDQGKLGLQEAVKFLMGYTTACQFGQRECYAATLLLPLMEHVVFEQDPHRAKQENAHTVYEEMERFIDVKMPIDYKKLVITCKTVEDRATEDRATQVEEFLKKL
jgi:predicted ATPase